jgi:hypothetical protein
VLPASELRQLYVLSGGNRISVPAELAVESPVNKSTIPVIYECEWLSLRGEVDVISAGPFAHSQLKVNRGTGSIRTLTISGLPF